jgi:hypothetical protein
MASARKALFDDAAYRTSLRGHRRPHLAW